MTDVPLDPVGAALHATLVQGGFSTPAIEAFRILTDCLTQLRSTGELSDRYAEGAAATLTWIAENDTEEVRAERDLWLMRLARDDVTWDGVRGDLLEAIRPVLSRAIRRTLTATEHEGFSIGDRVCYQIPDPQAPCEHGTLTGSNARGVFVLYDGDAAPKHTATDRLVVLRGDRDG